VTPSPRGEYGGRLSFAIEEDPHQVNRVPAIGGKWKSLWIGISVFSLNSGLNSDEL
jgi:hypothetical protein